MPWPHGSSLRAHATSVWPIAPWGHARGPGQPRSDLGQWGPQFPATALTLWGRTSGTTGGPGYSRGRGPSRCGGQSPGSFRCRAELRVYRTHSLATATSAAALLEYQHFRKGPLSSNAAEAGAYLKTRPEVPIPDLQLFFAPTWFMEHGFIQPEGHGLDFLAVQLSPESRGSVRLRSHDPLDSP
jgi:hypothetical protein